MACVVSTSAFASSAPVLPLKTRAELKTDSGPNRIEQQALTSISASSYYDALSEVTSESSVAPKGTAVFRVQGGVLPSASRIRFALDDAGKIIIRGDDMLFINVNQKTRALEFLARRGEGASLVRFELKPEFVETLRKLAVPQRAGRQFPGSESQNVFLLAASIIVRELNER